MVIRFFKIRIKLNVIRFRRRQKEESFSVLCYRFSYICLQMSCFICNFAIANFFCACNDNLGTATKRGSTT